ncbi:hypothetical protein CBR_g19202 [Chara braunii]|uniref:DEK-C domain-containing protein n=1 Tax=Chara braunii TaxID=69332 RepID=A0A388JTK7_CHABU|nr:hypothetical protein CBR_g19202 [Chara braunii]|eukprot:GBG61125.1 hypothetical protein CBR_g19202 [Chara braunii]
MVSEREREAIESAVGKILEEADMEKVTERMVRSLAEKRTGIALSTRDHKDIVRRCIEEFLEKVQAEPEEEPDEEEEKKPDRKRKSGRNEDGEEVDEDVEEEEKERKSKKSKSHEKKGATKGSGSGSGSGAKVGGGGRTTGSNGEIIVCKLSDKRRVTVSLFKGKVYVGIREYYEKEGEMLPTQKGISLSVDQWKKFKEAVPDIQDIIKQRL